MRFKFSLQYFCFIFRNERHKTLKEGFILCAQKVLIKLIYIFDIYLVYIDWYIYKYIDGFYRNIFEIACESALPRESNCSALVGRTGLIYTGYFADVLLVQSFCLRTANETWLSSSSSSRCIYCIEAATPPSSVCSYIFTKPLYRDFPFSMCIKMVSSFSTSLFDN